MAELLHWVTLVTRLVDLVVTVPFPPPGHGPLAHRRVTVVVEPRVAPLIVLTTVTVQSNRVVAPVALPLKPLHWSMVLVVAALAEEVGRTNPAIENALSTATKLSRIVRRVNGTGKPTAWAVPIVRIKR